MNNIKCKKCGELFVYEITGAVYPGGKDKETIACPYCGEINGSFMTSGFIHSYKLDENGNKVC